jgi:hypothetical protein
LVVLAGVPAVIEAVRDELVVTRSRRRLTSTIPSRGSSPRAVTSGNTTNV